MEIFPLLPSENKGKEIFPQKYFHCYLVKKKKSKEKNSQC